MVLRKISTPKFKEVTQQRKLHNDEFHNLYNMYSTPIKTVINKKGRNETRMCEARKTGETHIKF